MPRPKKCSPLPLWLTSIAAPFNSAKSCCAVSLHALPRRHSSTSRNQNGSSLVKTKPTSSPVTAANVHASSAPVQIAGS